MRLNSLTHWSKVLIATSFVVLFSPLSSTFAVASVSGNGETKLSNSSQKQLLADKDDDKEGSRVIRRRVTTEERRVITTSYKKAKKSGFTLAIWQPAGSFSEVIARVSIKSKHSKKYLKERYLGDYKYKIKQKAKFVKGFKEGDRIVVRLFDTSNRFIGYSEFECLSGNNVVNLILSANPSEYQVVRTVYGVDADEDGTIDQGSYTYDYFTEVKDQKVTFLSSAQSVKVSEFQVEGYSQVATNSVYPVSFAQGQYSLVRQTITAFTSELAQAFLVTPGSLVQVTEVSDNSSFELGQLLTAYREVGVAKGIQVAFSDISSSYWARDFIAELAAMEIIEGFPDGSFRPDAPVTRAEFAALLRKAFSKSKVRNAIAFRDVSSSYWAYNAIGESYEMGFFNISGRNFNPTRSLTRLEILVALAQAFNYKTTGSTTNILSVFSDYTKISQQYRSVVAALVERGVVVNYPDVKQLNVEKVATRAEVCALLYKALASSGEVVDISSQYAVKPTVEQSEIERDDDDDREGKVKPERRNCNQGIGNGAEGCDPGNSRPRGGSNDEGGRTPGGKK
ncbi:MAG TPA: S-layer homology domain-containing protein [Nostocaceae cyanobacterium]|nr:S-layer homology domain-containing protein [Nostocaceae cyanobacterium]